MEIDLSRLRPEGEDQEGQEPPAVLDLDEEDIRIEGPLHYALHVQVVSGELIVRGQLRLNVAFRCCRCAEFFPFTVRERAFSVDRELSEDEECVDLTPDLREAILLAFPSYPVCRADCAGLCAQCGANWNRESCDCVPMTDDRWGALDGWGEKEGQAETPGA